VVADPRHEIGIGLPVHEGIVRAIHRPWSFRDLRKLNEAPVDFHHIADSEVVAHGGGNIDARALVFGSLRLGIAKDVGVVIGGEGAAIFPLRVADFSIADDLEPASPANGVAGFWAVSFKPRNDSCGFGFVPGVVQAIVVGEGDVERVELWGESQREVSVAPFWVIEPPVICLPFLIPGGLVVWSGVVLRWLFTNPENRSSDELLPRVNGLLILIRIRRRGRDLYLRSILPKERKNEETKEGNYEAWSQRSRE